MKKIIIITIFSFFSALSSQAQIMKLGVKGGINLANFTGKDISSKSITNYHFGAIAQFRLAKSFAFQPELLYSTIGAKYEKPINDIAEEFKNELGYISIPIILKINLSKSISLDFGPQFSFLVNSRNNFKPQDTNSYDMALLAGLGLDITKNISIQGRYGLGLTEVALDTDIKNSIVQFSLALLF